MNIKKFKRKYKSIQIFISLIIILIILSLISTYRLENNVFLSSILLNIFGGLCTGLIILVYQFYSKKKEDEIIYIIDKLASIDNINIKEASILDFRTDEYIVNEQDENYIEEVLSYYEAATYALYYYINTIENAKKELVHLTEFFENVLTLSVDIYKYEEELNEVFEYFNKYQFKEEYKQGPYLLRKKGSDEIVCWGTSDIKCPDNTYYIDRPGDPFTVEYVYYNDIKVEAKGVCNEWISKINNLKDKTDLLNFKLNKEKEMIIKYHKSSTIIN